MQLVAGARVAGKYELERCIGVGGMGEVWSAVQSPTRKRVALKFLKPAKDESAAEADATRKRFLREARAACAVQHPNVVEIHDVLVLDDGAPVMVMEFLSGETLEARLTRDGRVPLGEIAAVLARVVSAVGAAHALGIVHRDLKPDNVFLADTADGVDVKVLDFGIAKLTALDGDAAQTGGLTGTGAMLGTPYYMSPEQAFGERNIDHRADVWSLGIILYRALTGVLPTRGDNIGQILKIIMMSEIEPIEALAPALPPDVVELVARMLSPKREDRPESLEQVKGVLERYAGIEVADFGAPVTPEQDVRAEAPGRPRVRSDAPAPAMATRQAMGPKMEGDASIAGVAGGPRPRRTTMSRLVWGGVVGALVTVAGMTLLARRGDSSGDSREAAPSSTPASSIETGSGTANAPTTPAPTSPGPTSPGPTSPTPPPLADAPAPTSPSAAASTPPPDAPPPARTSSPPPPRPGPLPPPRETATPGTQAPAAPTGILEAPPVF